MSNEGPKFTWGDTVNVASHAPTLYEPGSVCYVVGIGALITDERLRRFNLPYGTIAYTVEYADGHSIEVPEKYLELVRKSEESEGSS